MKSRWQPCGKVVNIIRFNPQVAHTQKTRRLCEGKSTQRLYGNRVSIFTWFCNSAQYSKMLCFSVDCNTASSAPSFLSWRFHAVSFPYPYLPEETSSLQSPGTSLATKSSESSWTFLQIFSCADCIGFPCWMQISPAFHHHR